MKLACLLLLLWSTMAHAGLRDRFPDLVQVDPPSASRRAPASGVRITYLGTNGYLLEARGAVILIDPYFSRVGLLRCLLNGRTVPRTALIDQWLQGVPRVDAVLATHGHVDHLSDVPQILRRRPRARLYTTGTGIALVRSTGVPPAQLQTIRPGSVIHAGQATVRVLPGTHDRALGKIFFEGALEHLPPTHVADWKCGETLAYLIEIGGRRLYLAAGSQAQDRPPPGLGHIDLAFQGVATADSLQAFPSILAALQPVRVLPSHLDNFFQPLESGFHFLPFTNFPRVRQEAQAQGSRIILLDYFQPWTLR